VLVPASGASALAGGLGAAVDCATESVTVASATGGVCGTTAASAPMEVAPASVAAGASIATLALADAVREG
jgi:hypothetical protein